MKIFECLVIFGIMLTFASCSDEDKILLAGCCGNQPISESLGNAQIYVPNIFTPNGDGLNDIFLVQGDSIREVVRLEVRNRKDDLDFQVNLVKVDDYTMAWDGKEDGK